MRRAAATASVCIAVLAAGAAAAAPALAESPQPIVGAAGEVFTDTSYTLAGGSIATLQWTGGGSHNATAAVKGPDGGPLFRSATIGAGTTPVDGTQYLASGSYPFLCTIHSGMTSTLAVSGGAALARPKVSVRVLSKKLGPVAASGKLKLSATLSGATSANLVAKLGAKKIGSATTKGGTTNLKLTKSGKTALGAKTKAKVSVTATVDFGSPAAASAKLK